jgi:glycosyltransferase involved in cell wall biosynthesis
MRILLATPLYPPDSGGPSTYAKLLVDELPKRGIEVTLVKFGDVRHLPPVVRHVVYFLKLLGSTKDVDIVYALDPVSVGLPASLAALFCGKKFLVRIPGDYAWEQGRQRFGVVEELDGFQNKRYNRKVERLRSIQKFVVHRASTIVVPSKYMQGIVMGWVKDGAKVEVIYSSIHQPVAFEPLTNRPVGFLVLSFGRNVPWKGFEALRTVVARNPNWTLKIFSELPHKEAMGWLKAADVYVNNSTYEGLSHQLVEAMALGTPIVATDVGGNPELITSGQNGLLIPPKDDEALYKALKDIETHKDDAQMRAEKAKEKAQQFSIDITIEKLVTLLKSI